MTKTCFHCGDECRNQEVVFDQKSFCCHGCKSVYQILNTSDLENFYQLNKSPGIKPNTARNSSFEFLDSPDVFEKLVDFHDDGMVVVTFSIPVIHCTSCVWLLESLPKIKEDIKRVQVDFNKRTVQVVYENHAYKLSELASYLMSLGYEPSVSLESLEKKDIGEKIESRKLLLKLSVAGFCFGNVMLFAFPEYFNKKDIWFENYNMLFKWLMFLLSIPVVFYSASDYFVSTYKALKNKVVNLDVPIAIGIAVLFLRSIYEAYMGVSSGYFDSLCGLVFFMLVGRYFQKRTYQSIVFDRDYKSFYPIGVKKILQGEKQNILIGDISIGDRLWIRNGEIVPADSILIEGEGGIDNSFITGESRVLKKQAGDKLFSGAKVSGESVVVEVIKEVNESYLTSLWKHEAFSDKQSFLNLMTHKISKYFVWAILVITVFTAIFWYFKDYTQLFRIVSAILIVACPCALALSAPFALGNSIRYLAGQMFFVKDIGVIENLSKVKYIVFDKTGTITESKSTDIIFEGDKLSEFDFSVIQSVLSESTHPLSQALSEKYMEKPSVGFLDWQEVLGKGVKAKVDGKEVLLGSRAFLVENNVFIDAEQKGNQTSVWYSWGGELKGFFVFQNQYRENLQKLLKSLSLDFHLSVLSGDNDSEKSNLEKMFPEGSHFLFKQSPEDKLNYISQLQDKGQVLMLGDGLNDAGALKKSDVGVSVVEGFGQFTPACDGILSADNLQYLSDYIRFSKKSVGVVWVSFVISFLYNIVGLSFAISGYLRPVVAAILMPVSSISVVLFASFAVFILSKKIRI